MNIHCKNCGNWMEQIASREDSQARDYIMLWCPECGTVCGEFMERHGPQDDDWRFPKMTAFPEIKAALIIGREDPKRGA
jgi:hypothetical protein